MIEPEDLEPRRIELDWNLATDPYQIQERFMRNNYQKILSLQMWMNVVKWVPRRPTSSHRSIPILTQRKALHLEDGGLRKMLASPLYRQDREDCEYAVICRKAVDREFVNTCGFSATFFGWTAKTAIIGAAIRQIP